MTRWLAAVALAAIMGPLLVRWWYHHVEPRLFERRDPLPPLPRRQPPVPREGPSLPPGDEGHLMFAVRLQEVADRYVEACEDRLRPGGRMDW